MDICKCHEKDKDTEYPLCCALSSPGGLLENFGDFVILIPDSDHQVLPPCRKRAAVQRENGTSIVPCVILLKHQAGLSNRPAAAQII